jgi:FkbM family methyltransferase
VGKAVASRYAEDWKQAYEHKEQPLIDLFSKEHGGLFLDVGAHAGRWTIPLAGVFDSVVAFEPNPNSSQMLSKEVDRMGLYNVAVWNAGVAERPGYAFLSELDGTPSRSTLYPEFSRLPVTRRFRAYFVNLDEWFKDSLFEKVSLIKVDTEGSELEVLKSAKGILSKGTRLCVETHSDGLYEGCANLLRSLGLDFETIRLTEDAPASLHAKEGQKHRYIVRTHE